MNQAIRIVVAIALGVAIAACTSFRARPDLRTSTLTQPVTHCVKGRQTRQVGAAGAYGMPVVEVTDRPCEAKP